MHKAIQRRICNTGWRITNWVDIIWTVCYFFYPFEAIPGNEDRLYKPTAIVTEPVDENVGEHRQHYSENNSFRWWQHAQHNECSGRSTTHFSSRSHPHPPTYLNLGTAATVCECWIVKPSSSTLYLEALITRYVQRLWFIHRWPRLL